MSPHRCFLLLISVLLPMPVGCGLKEYEERMDEERRLAKAFDAMEDLLDGTLEPPMVKDKPAWNFEVFLRVPHGCQRTFKSRYLYNEVNLFRYPFALEKAKDDKGEAVDKTGWNLLVACPGVAIASNEEFRRRVLGALSQYYSKEFQIKNFDPRGKGAKIEPDFIEIETGPDKKIDYERTEYNGPKDFHFQVYIHRAFIERDDSTTSNLIALVFQTQREDPTFVPARDACLKTLDISEDATKTKLAFQSTHKPRK